jgi:hypothetical protein
VPIPGCAEQSTRIEQSRIPEHPAGAGHAPRDAPATHGDATTTAPSRTWHRKPDQRPLCRGRSRDVNTAQWGQRRARPLLRSSIRREPKTGSREAPSTGSVATVDGLLECAMASGRVYACCAEMPRLSDSEQLRTRAASSLPLEAGPRTATREPASPPSLVCVAGLPSLEGAPGSLRTLGRCTITFPQTAKDYQTGASDLTIVGGGVVAVRGQGPRRGGLDQAPVTRAPQVPQPRSRRAEGRLLWPGPGGHALHHPDLIRPLRWSRSRHRCSVQTSPSQ